MMRSPHAKFAALRRFGEKRGGGDLSPVFNRRGFAQVFTNGKTAHALYRRHQKEKWAVPEFCLPSTSPANAAWSFERLLEAYRAILPYLADDQTGVQASPDQGAQPGNSANGK
jgi:G:T/U-mismatch repair DNA glycosylase